jgi:type II secretory pathway pseudopilin PulG
VSDLRTASDLRAVTDVRTASDLRNRIIRPNIHRATARGGFTFLEVLFAVILLGIGFIMIAAIFPVAIAQNTASANEDQGTLICRSAAQEAQGVASDLAFPPTNGSIVPFNAADSSGTYLNPIGQGQFLSADKRYAWVGFYRREGAVPPLFAALSPYAQVFIFAIRNPNFANGVIGPISVTTGISANFIAATATTPGIVTINNAGGRDVEGSFILVAQNTPRMVAGRILRIGASTGTADTFYLQPGSDLQSGINEAGNNVPVYLIGADVNSSTPALQDIACMSSFIRINQ